MRCLIRFCARMWRTTVRPTRLQQMQNVSPDLVRRIIRLVELAEYKRQQAAPVLKVSKKAFGMGRRFPIAARREV